MNIPEAIAQLTAELDPDTVAELINQYLSDTPQQIATLRAAAAAGDLKTLGRTAHSIAGSSSTFGLEHLRAAARTLEDAALAGDTSAIAARIDALAQTFAAAVPELQAATAV
jgi:HPt (histidine-containing phosphotransfer) domain-containing protein